MADVRALIRENGQVRNSLDTDTIQIGAVDIGVAGVLSIGTVNATGINIGQIGMTTTFLGNVDVDGILTIVDGGSLISDGDVTLGGGDGDTITLGGTYATANDIVNIGTSAVGGDTVVNLRTAMGVSADKRITFNRAADSESAFILPDTKDAPAGLAAGMIRVNGAGLLEWYTGAAWVTTATTGYTLDDAYNASAGAAAVTVDAGDVNWNLTGAYSFTVDISSGSTGTGDGFHVEEGTDYFRLNHSDAGEIAWTADLGAVMVAASKGATFDFNNGFSIDGSGSASNLSSTSDNLTISTITSGTLFVTSAGTLDMDGVAVTLDASGGFSIDGAGAACNVSATSQDLTISTITAGTLALTSAALLTLSDGYKAGSSYATDLVLSDSSAEWSAFDTAFGEVSVFSAITALKDGNAATVTVADSSSATCWVGLYEAVSGSLAAKTDAALKYNASTGALAATSMGVAAGGAFTYNAVNVIRAQTSISNFWFGNSGNLTATGTNNLGVGYEAGLGLTSGISCTFVGYSSGKANTDGGSNSYFGYNSGLAVSAGSSNAFFGTSAGRYYSSGTSILTAAEQCVYLGASSRANANTMTNEIVIGYNAIGAGSNTATLGNTSITSTVLRGAVSGPTSITATTAGTAKAITDVLTINNSAHAADMDGTGSGILFNLTEDTGATAVDAGRIVVAAEQDLTSTAASQDSYMAFYASLDGALAEKARITSSAYLGIGRTDPSYPIDVTGSAAATVRLHRAANTAGNTVQEVFALNNSSGIIKTYAIVYGEIVSPTAGSETGALVFQTSATGAVSTTRLRIDEVGNALFNGCSRGSSAAGVLGLASGTAPTTSPADAVQMWSGDFNAAAGKSALHLRDESGILSVFGNNWGLFTAGAEVIDASAEKTIFLSNGTRPSAHTDNGTYFYSQDCSGSYNSGLASASFFSEEPVQEIGSYVPDHVWPINIRGETYLVFLQACTLA